MPYDKNIKIKEIRTQLAKTRTKENTAFRFGSSQVCKTMRQPSPTLSARRGSARWQRNAMQNKPANLQRPDPAQRKLMPHHPTYQSQKQHQCQSPRRRHSSRLPALRKLKLHRTVRGAGAVTILDHDVNGLAGMGNGTTEIIVRAAGSTEVARLA